ncbi:MAG: hypothetical protein VXY94_05895 [Planctomycetota bacterium]|nr:hypothetical protein [Planctomycetota bacterium]MEC8734289.1 hypothetical protein [Planctomycetota bacterium]MEC9158209.1 hypothetical protein [Planctomycetota bacterium]MEC9234350.1 hypothetical protein [Planctomycetota bacterium]
MEDRITEAPAESHGPRPADTRPPGALAHRHLRLFAVAYILLLVVGTHWPRLDVGTAPGGSDKLLHFLGFGLLVFALRISGWLRGFWSLCATGLAAAILVELTQHVLPIGRHWSIPDVTAGGFGIVVAATIVASVGPAGGRGADRLRRRWFEIAWSLLARSGPCLNILVAGALGVLVLGLGGVLCSSLLLPDPAAGGSGRSFDSLDLFVLGGLLGGIPAMALSFLAGFRHESAALKEPLPWQVLWSACRTRVVTGLVQGSVIVLLVWWLLRLGGISSLIYGGPTSGGPGLEPIVPLIALGIGLAYLLRTVMVGAARIADTLESTSEGDDRPRGAGSDPIS